MKACIVKIESTNNYYSHDDVDELYKIVPETAFEEITDSQYKDLVEMTHEFPSYILLTLFEKPTINKTIQSVMEDIRKIKKDREEQKNREKLAEAKRQQKLKTKREARELKKLQELQAKFGIKG